MITHREAQTFDRENAIFDRGRQENRDFKYLEIIIASIRWCVISCEHNQIQFGKLLAH